MAARAARMAAGSQLAHLHCTIRAKQLKEQHGETHLEILRLCSSNMVKRHDMHDMSTQTPMGISQVHTHRDPILTWESQ